MKLLPLISALILGSSQSYASEDLKNVLNQGFKAIVPSINMQFDGCEIDKVYKVWTLLFVCSETDFNFDFGSTVILSNGHTYYLCTEDEQCYRGKIYEH